MGSSLSLPYEITTCLPCGDLPAMSQLLSTLQARDWLSSYWSGYNSPSQLSRIRNTGVPQNFLKEVGHLACLKRLLRKVILSS